MDASLSMRTDRYQIGTPFGRLAENCACCVSNPYASLCRESSSPQFACNPINECTSRLLLIFQLGSITLSHFRRRDSVNRLQNVQNQDFCIFMPYPDDHSAEQIFSKTRIVDCQ
jgi:hypothetical protein